MNEPIIDLPDVLERVQNDKPLLLELLDIFQEDFINKRKALGDAIAAKDIGKIKDAAHSIKGSSGNISVKAMFATCVQLEQLARSNTFSGMDALVKDIDAQFAELKIYAVNLKKEWGGG